MTNYGGTGAKQVMKCLSQSTLMIALTSIYYNRNYYYKIKDCRNEADILDHK